MVSTTRRRHNATDEPTSEAKVRKPRRSKAAGTQPHSNVESSEPARSSLSWAEGMLIAVYYASIAYSAVYMVHWVPEPQPASVPPSVFSEERAMEYTRVLAKDIGMRQVSTPGIERAADYIQRELEELTLMPSVRHDVDVEVERQTTSGAVNFRFIGTNITNVYYNLTNIVMRITPRGMSGRKGLLVSAHYDSTIGTVGASDCASCVGVCMELVRVLLTNASLQLSAPVTFLFNGGEETLMQAAHGFMADPNNVRQLAAFINVESTGPYGLPLLFQHTGSWTAATYAKSAKYPRGTSFSQDFFDSGIIPADTDYKMFSSQHKGSLPGIDVAFTLGGTAYHTNQDVVERIRPGTLQELGDDLVGAVTGFTAEISAREAGIGVLEGDDTDTAVYFDLWSMAMVVYSKSIATWIHGAPLLMLFLFPPYAAMLHSMDPGQQATPAPASRGPPVSVSYISILSASFNYLGAVVLAVGMPCLLGMARALLAGPGKGIVFFAHKPLAVLMYAPMALLGFMIPFAAPGIDVVSATLGAAFFWGMVGVWATHSGLGMSVYPFLWTVAVGPSLLVTQKSSRFSQLLFLSIGTTLGVFLGWSSSVTLLYHVMDKVTLTGRAPGFFGPALVDGGIGALFGLSSVMCAGTLGPALIASGHKIAQRLMPVLLLTSVASALIGSLVFNPYTPQHPQRLFTQHLHVVDRQGEVSSYWAVCGTDVNPVDTLLNATYRPIAQPITQQAIRYLYPLSNMLHGVMLPGPPPDPNVLPRPPDITVTHREFIGESELRLHVLVDLQHPCWSTLNVTGPIVGWSFTDEPIPLNKDASVPSYLVRYAGNAGSDKWMFWVALHPDATLYLDLTAKYHQASPLVDDFSAQFPDHVSNTELTVYHRDVVLRPITGPLPGATSNEDAPLKSISQLIAEAEEQEQ